MDSAMHVFQILRLRPQNDVVGQPLDGHSGIRRSPLAAENLETTTILLDTGSGLRLVRYEGNSCQPTCSMRV
jgi:hypothetical protein